MCRYATVQWIGSKPSRIWSGGWREGARGSGAAGGGGGREWSAGRCDFRPGGPAATCPAPDRGGGVFGVQPGGGPVQPVAWYAILGVGTAVVALAAVVAGLARAAPRAGVAGWRGGRCGWRRRAPSGTVGQMAVTAVAAPVDFSQRHARGAAELTGVFRHLRAAQRGTGGPAGDRAGDRAGRGGGRGPGPAAGGGCRARGCRARGCRARGRVGQRSTAAVDRSVGLSATFATGLAVTRLAVWAASG
jgi:hypothetical protein